MATLRRPLVPVLALVLCLAVAALGVSPASGGAGPVASAAKKKCSKIKNKKKRKKCQKTQGTSPTGTGTGTAKLLITPTSAAFTAGLNTLTPSGPVQFTITNIGTVKTKTLTALITRTSGSGTFTLAANDCGVPLTPEASCISVVNFTGSNVFGSSAGNLKVSDPTVSVTAQLTGTTGP